MAQMPAADSRSVRAPSGAAAITAASRKRAVETQTSSADFSDLFASAQQARRTALRDRARQAGQAEPTARQKSQQKDKSRTDEAQPESRADALRESTAEQQKPSRADQMRDSVPQDPADSAADQQPTGETDSSRANADSTSEPSKVSASESTGDSSEAGSATAETTKADDAAPNVQPVTDTSSAGANQVAASTPTNVGTNTKTGSNSTGQADKPASPGASAGITVTAAGAELQTKLQKAAGAGPQAAAGENAAASGSNAGADSASGQFENALDAASGAKAAGRSARAAVATAKPQIQDPVDLAEPNTVNELARVLRAASKDGHSNLLMRLDPPELGQVQVDVRMHGDVLTLRMEAQTPAGQQALQSKLADLRTALEQQGIQVGQVQVDLRPAVASPPQDAPAQQQGWQGGGQSGGNAQQQGGNPGSSDGHQNWTRNTETKVETGSLRGLDLVA